jgi:hypothetical protein
MNLVRSIHETELFLNDHGYLVMRQWSPDLRHIGIVMLTEEQTAVAAKEMRRLLMDRGNWVTQWEGRGRGFIRGGDFHLGLPISFLPP